MLTVMVELDHEVHMLDVQTEFLDGISQRQRQRARVRQDGGLL